MKVYDKLVRERIPEIKGSSGNKCKIEVVSGEVSLGYLYKKLQLNSLFDRMADFDDDLSDLFKDRINELGKEIKELSAKYNDLVN